MRFHDLRHAHASVLLAAGVHPKVVQERLGHSQVSVTLDTYSDVAQSLQREAPSGGARSSRDAQRHSCNASTSECFETQQRCESRISSSCSMP
jgi:hypothetical protein